MAWLFLFYGDFTDCSVKVDCLRNSRALDVKKVNFLMFGYIFGDKMKDDSKLFYFLRSMAFFERNFVKVSECLIF